MHNRWTTAYESTAFLLMIALLIAGMFSVAAGQLNTSKEFFSEAALERSLREVYSKAELMPSGSQERAKLLLPPNISHVRIEARDGAWELRLALDGREYTKTSSVKLVFVPGNILETPGVHTVLIRKESESSALVLETQ